MDKKGLLQGLAGWTVVGIIAYFFFFHNPPNQAKLLACNVSPYTIQQVVLAETEQGFKSLGGWRSLNSGDCFAVENKFHENPKGFYLHTKIPSKDHKFYNEIHDIRSAYTSSLNATSSEVDSIDPFPELASYSGELLTCTPDENDLSAELIPKSTMCEGLDVYPGYFMPAWTLDDDSNWYYAYEDAFIPLLSASGNAKFQDTLKTAANAAAGLKQSLEVQLFNRREWGGKMPFSFGGQLEDENGPLGLGVTITDIVENTIFGTPMPFISGDVIIKINNQRVFGVRDANQKLINHGLSRQHGIGKPVIYDVLRGDYHTRIETTYFFNDGYRSFDENQEGVAFWYGLGDAVTFGQTPWAMCHGNNLIRGIGKLGLSAFEFLESKLEERQYNSERHKAIDFIDAEECTWQNEQAKALAQQKEEEVYINSQWVAIFTPSGIRAVGGRALTKHAARRALGKGALSKAVSEGALEAVETALWTIGTSAPETTLKNRLGEAIRYAPLGAAGGSISSLIFSANSNHNKHRK